MAAERVVDVIEEQLDNGVVGVALAAVARGDVVWSGGFGRLDFEQTEPVTTRSTFAIQSVSKSIVATALMHWVERGAIGLDDPVNRHLAPIAVDNDWEERNPVTIRHLLTHTAGLPLSLGWGASGSLEEMVANDVRTEAEPGTRLIYANWGYDVLGYLVSRLAGAPWEEAVADTVLRPLGMTATRTARPEPADTGAGEATGHVVSQVDGAVLRVESGVWPYYPGPPSGSLMSNVEDLARFLVAHLSDGAGVLTRDTFAEMQRVHAPLGRGGGGMGLGFRVDRRNGRPFFCHTGDGVGFATFVGGHPDEQVGVALLINVGGAETARSKIVSTALDWLLTDAPARTTAAAIAPRPHVGGYRSTYWGLRAEVSEDADAFVVRIPTNVIASGESVSVLRESGGRWQAEGGMFDGCELDFDTTGDEPRFYGGLYPFEFVADETLVNALPTEVDEHGDLDGSWTGTIDTPVGVIPIDLTVDVQDGSARVDVMGTVAVDTDAEARAGWLRARFELDVVGFGAITLFARLGLAEGRLRGVLYARNPSGEIVMAAVLGRTAPGGPTS